MPGPAQRSSIPASGPSPTKGTGGPGAGNAPRVLGLDLLRAVAILAVVFAHGIVVLYPHMPAWFGLLGHGGFYGVELFFVLSGFLIGRILIRSSADLAQARNIGRFWTRRWFRTLPLFWLFLLVNIALELFVRGHSLHLTDVLSHGFFLRNFSHDTLSFFGESWSLAIEEWFYLLFPAALWLGLRFSRRFDPVFLSVAAGFFLFSTVGRAYCGHIAGVTWADGPRKIVILRFDALMTGVFAAWIACRFPFAWRARARGAALAGTLLLAGLYANLWTIVDGKLAPGTDAFFARTFRFTLVSIGFALLLPASSAWKPSREFFGGRVIRLIALWSYALYLVHLPMMELVQQHAFPEWQRSFPQALASFTLQIGGSIAASALLYHGFEARCTRLRERFAPAVAPGS